MANEIYPYPRSILRCGAETTYGSSSLANTTFTTALDAEVDAYIPTVNERPILSPLRPGALPYSSTVRATFSVTTEVPHVTLTTGGENPHCHALLDAAGFARTEVTNGNFDTVFDFAGEDASGDDKIATYTLKSNPTGSMTVQFDRFNEDQSSAYIHKMTGARGNWTLSFVAGETLKLTVEGAGLSSGAPANAAISANQYSHDGVSNFSTSPTLSSQVPAICLGAYFAIQEAAGNTYYGGGTAAMNNALRSFELNGNMNAVEDITLQGSNGIKRVRLTPDSPFSGSMQLELVSASEFNFESLCNSNTLIKTDVYIVDPASAANVIQVSFQSVISEVSHANADNMCVVDLTLTGAYDESGADGGGLVVSDGVKLIWATMV